MLKKKPHCLSACLWASVFIVVSAPASAAPAWIQSTVKFVYPLGDGSFVLGFVNDAGTCTSTNSPKYFYVVAGQNGVTADGLKAMLATALTAFSTGSTLSASFDDATSSCYINRFSMQ